CSAEPQELGLAGSNGRRWRLPEFPLRKTGISSRIPLVPGSVQILQGRVGLTLSQIPADGRAEWPEVKSDRSSNEIHSVTSNIPACLPASDVRANRVSALLAQVFL